jgi:N-acetylmuramic acid 6-phosphate etherase
VADPLLDGPWSTEAVNPRTVDLDRVGMLEVMHLLHAEDHHAVRAVDAVLPEVARAAEWAAAAYAAGGRWLFVGAGTSGRIALAEAAECPPTFGTPADRVVALMAGGPDALRQAREGAEDDAAAGRADLTAQVPTGRDLVVGLAASGRTPYVLAAVEAARAAGAKTVGVACVPGSPLAQVAELAITPDTGAEAVLGSTRLKAGTAQKLVMNMITTGAMVRLGRVYRNLMVDMRATNDKLRERAVRLVALGAVTGEGEARRALEASGGEVKTAIVCLLLSIGPEEARARLDAVGGRVLELLPER